MGKGRKPAIWSNRVSSKASINFQFEDSMTHNSPQIHSMRKLIEETEKADEINKKK